MRRQGRRASAHLFQNKENSRRDRPPVALTGVPKDDQLILSLSQNTIREVAVSKRGPSSSHPMEKSAVSRQTRDVKARLQQRLAPSALLYRRATSVAGDTVTHSLGHHRDFDAINRITRRMVAPHSKNPDDGSVPLPLLSTSLRELVNTVSKAAGLSTSGAPKRRPLSPTLEEPDHKRLRMTESPPLSQLSETDLTFAAAALDGQTAGSANLERTQSMQALDAYRRSNGLVFTWQDTALFGATTEHIRIHGSPRSGKTTMGEACALAYGREDARALILISDQTSFVAVRACIGQGSKYVDVLTTSQLIERLRPVSSSTTRAPPSYAVIVLDDMQNCTPDMYETVQSLISAMDNDPRLVVIGDPSLDVATFLGGDQQFFEHAPTLFAASPGSPGRQWKEVELRKSRTISNQLALYINRVTHTAARSALLAPFGNDFVVRVLNGLTKRGIPCTAFGQWKYSCMRQKLVATTFFQSRNLPKKDLVILIGVDALPVHRKCTDLQCPPGVILAHTRPAKQLVEIRTTTVQLPWRREHEVAKYATVEHIPANLSHPFPARQLSLPPQPSRTVHNLAASDIASSESGSDATALHALIENYLVVKVISGAVEPKCCLEPRDEVSTKFGLVEYVGDLNGMVLTAALKAGRPFDVADLMQKAIEQHATLSRSIQRKTALEGTPYTWFDDT
ncbi:hypothetical protein C8R46DRAFT_1186484 [Mycena filopes]|nr:hypothetical protein C8R46DRAFT_1186484 [Mycena filopes]